VPCSGAEPSHEKREGPPPSKRTRKRERSFLRYGETKLPKEMIHSGRNMAHLLNVVFVLEDGAVHDVCQAEVLALVRKVGLGYGHYLLPVARLDARLPQVLDDGEDLLEVCDLA